jgi:glycosyl transferase family 25
MWEFIDKAVYINLDHREDRRIIMKQFFEEAKIPSENVERFPAIRHSVGIVGCAMGHIAILKRAKAQCWKSVLILEDDMRWIDFHTNYPKLESLVNGEHWDVFMLGGLFLQHELPRIKMAFCTNAYIVQSHYYDILLDNFETGLRKKLDAGKPTFFAKTPQSIAAYNNRVNLRNQYNVDVYWFKLQEKDNWIGLGPMCDQLPTYSDIYNKVVVHQDATAESLLPYAQRLRSIMDIT